MEVVNAIESALSNRGMPSNIAIRMREISGSQGGAMGGAVRSAASSNQSSQLETVGEDESFKEGQSETAETIKVNSAMELDEVDGQLVGRLVRNALLRAGCPAKSATARTEELQAQLRDVFHIYSASKMCNALSKSSNDLVALRALLKDNLLQQLQAEMALLLSAVSHAIPAQKPRKVTLHITRIDWLQLSNISQKSQSFGAEIFVQGTFVGGKTDPGLSSSSDEFPLDICGRPTFRPSAHWFLNLVEFKTTMSTPSTLMSTVVTSGNDLQMNKKVVGTFFNEFDGFHLFPFDMEKFTIFFVIGCANEGATPVEISFADYLKPSVVDQANCAERNAWEISPALTVELTTVSASKDRSFPAIAISACAFRRPFFFLVNIALPACVFSLLAVMIMILPVSYPPSRLIYQLTLTLTVVSYKLSTTSIMPTVTYLTAIDKYQLSSAGIILFCLFENVIAGSLMDDNRGKGNYEPDLVALIDHACMGLAGVAWLSLNGWWVSLMLRESRKRTEVHKTAQESVELAKAQRRRSMLFMRQSQRRPSLTSSRDSKAHLAQERRGPW